MKKSALFVHFEKAKKKNKDRRQMLCYNVILLRQKGDSISNINSRNWTRFKICLINDNDFIFYQCSIITFWKIIWAVCYYTTTMVRITYVLPSRKKMYVTKKVLFKQKEKKHTTSIHGCESCTSLSSKWIAWKKYYISLKVWNLKSSKIIQLILTC